MKTMSRKFAKINSSDVAKLAGVSRSAVSRTFTEGAYVSEETRAKVQRAAEALDYNPNRLARSLTTNRSHILGVITTDLDNPFYATLLQELIEKIQEKQHAALVLRACEKDNDELITRLLSYQVDGLLITNAHLSSKMALQCIKLGKPVVTVNRYLDIEQIAAVTCDNASSAAQVADYLLDLGCKQIAFIAGDPNTSSSRDRELGFRNRLAERGAPLALEDTGFYTHEGGVQATRRLFAKRPYPDALFAANDFMAFAALGVIRRELGLRVPQDVSVFGFDNSLEADWPEFSLTTVDQNLPRMVDVAVDEILARIAGTMGRTRHRTVAGRLVIRESTGSLR